MSDEARRTLLHDLRGVIAAAGANVEYLREQGSPEHLSPVLDEIAHELRLVADAIALLGERDPDRRIELDLRALLWVAAREGARMRIDPTAPPFVVRGPAATVTAFVDALVPAVAPGAHGELEVVVKGASSTCVVRGLDAGASLDAALARAHELGLGPRLHAGMLTLVLPLG